MFCERCKIGFRENESALWCRLWNCPTTTQREPTKQQCAQFRIEERRRRRDEDDAD